MRTRVSSVAESRSNAASSSSPRISPAVATTSPSVRFLLRAPGLELDVPATSPSARFLRPRRRNAFRMPWISRRVSRERAERPNCRSTSSGV